MLCPTDIHPVDLGYLEKFNARVYQERIPLLGGIELSYQCNLNCVHCYLDQHARKQPNHRQVPVSKWLDIIDQLTDAGCLYLYFTGGETLLHPDFLEIYIHARKNGLMVVIFTNATRITEKVLETFDVYPPQHIDISIYGATRETYEAVTQVKGSFAKCMHGIEQLQAHGFAVKLKTILMSLNQHELKDMELFAQNKELSFRFDAMIFPRFNGDKEPVKYRVPPIEVVKKEFLSDKYAKDWCDAYERMARQVSGPDLYQCGAGLTLFHVDPEAQLRPCLMTPHVSFDLSNARFSDIWNSEIFLAFRKNKKMPKACQKCDLKVLCGFCPAFFRLETGEEDMISSYLCEIGWERKQAIGHIQNIQGKEA
ncbi:MAG: radical SAM protein [Desulfobacteraceae bacterium]|jgi:radical SAM protein with 4Fe4S-binding SPASM domain|nr:radical SAM protein [Desulfobacteraceae bacterium]